MALLLGEPFVRCAKVPTKSYLDPEPTTGVLTAQPVRMGYNPALPGNPQRYPENGVYSCLQTNAKETFKKNPSNLIL